MSEPQAPSASPLAASALFRKQALDAANARLYGDVLGGASPRWPVALAVLASCGLLQWLYFGSYTRTAGISGQLVPREGQIHVTSMQPGEVWRSAVSEGARVHAGDVLFELHSTRASPAQAATETAIAALTQSRRQSLLRDRWLQQQRDRQRADAEAGQHAVRLAELQSLSEQIVLQQRRVALAVESADRYAALHQSGFVPLLQWQERQGELLDERQRLAELGRVETALRQALQAAEQGWREQRLQSERERETTGRELAALEEAALDADAHRQWLLRAPRDGVVSSIVAVAGQSVAAGATLATLLPEPLVLEAELFAPSRAAGFLRVGQGVRLRYEAYAFQKFGLQDGRVSEVSATAMQLDPHSEPVYRVRVSLLHQAIRADGRWLPLRPASRVDASVLLEQRRLYEWLLEPLYALRRQR